MLKDDIEHHPFKYHYIKYPQTMNIFPEKPSMQAIKQGPLENCQLLASIGSILNTKGGADFIQNMMKQQDDGTTIVKLFNPTTKKFVYIQVENSYLSTKQQPIDYHTQPWIHILEKAYSVLASKSDKKVLLFPSLISVFTGENAEHSMLILTGKKANVVSVNQRLIHPFDDLLEESSAIIKKEVEEKNLFTTIKNSILFEIFNDTEKIKKWLNIFKENQLPIVALSRTFELSFKTYSKSIFDDGKRMYRLAMHFIDALEKQSILPADLLSNLKSYIKKFIDDEFSGPKGSGIYTSSQLKIFKYISDELKKNKSLTTNTGPRVDNLTETIGLTSKHEYMLLNTKEQFPLYLIQLRNPWGRKGRTYTYDEKQHVIYPKETTNAKFEMELTDFTSHFLNITSGEYSEKPFKK